MDLDGLARRVNVGMSRADTEGPELVARSDDADDAVV